MNAPTGSGEPVLSSSLRRNGHLPIEAYGALGDGRSVALSGADGSIDWWCAPNMDSSPLFDRLLDEGEGGRFSITPAGDYAVERRYRSESNVLETDFTTASGKARLTESLNSESAGRLPWCELARRVEALSGTVTFKVEMRLGRRADTAGPYWSKIGDHAVFHVGDVLGLLLWSDGVGGARTEDGFEGGFTITEGERRVLALIVGEGEPLAVPTIGEIDRRIDRSDDEWRQWSSRVQHAGPGRAALVRSALALKLLLYSPSGAIAAAATTSLPERIGGEKNYDYRYAWVRDTGYTIKAFLTCGALPEAKAALTWLLKRLREDGRQICYTLNGEKTPLPSEMAMAGYQGSRPVIQGNLATDQRQHSLFGDVLETAAEFARRGHVLDPLSAAVLTDLAQRCADEWRAPDSGIWELPEEQHYTMSKISCWQALNRAVELVDQGQLPSTHRERWVLERGRISEWIEAHCWSEKRQAFVFYPGSERLDAALALGVRFQYDGGERLRKTLDAIDGELRRGPFYYRYSGAEAEEGCFVPCSFWMIQARAELDGRQTVRDDFDRLMRALARGVGVLSEMVDPKDGSFLGNTPQGLSHLAHLMTIKMLEPDGEGSTT